MSAENPYAAPRTSSGAEGLADPSSHRPRIALASPLNRLIARALDAIFYVGSCVPGVVVGTTLANDESSLILAASLALLGVSIFYAYQCSLVVHRGETIGKRIAGIRIVDHASLEPPDFVHGVLLRSVVHAILGQVPLYGFIDACFVFTRDRRCLHDHIASTSVAAGAYRSAARRPTRRRG